MIYKFKVLSEEDDKFFMDVEILSDQTFYDFHNFIQEELEYDSSFLAKFFIANHNLQRKQEILLIIDKKSAKGTIAMDKAVLANFMKDAHQKLIYLFDILNDRTFFIELIETKPDSSSRYYPICTDFGGEIPPQFGKKNNTINIFNDEDDDIDVFKSKNTAPILDDDADEGSTPESFDKDINFEFEEALNLSDNAEEDEQEQPDIDNPEIDGDDDIDDNKE